MVKAKVIEKNQEILEEPVEEEKKKETSRGIRYSSLYSPKYSTTRKKAGTTYSPKY